MTELLPEAISSRLTDEEKASLPNTMVICHGRKHGIIEDIDYSSTIFNDTDESAGPDTMRNLSREKVEATHDMDMIIMMCCPNTVFSTVTDNDIGMPTDAVLNATFFNNIKRMLSKKGKLYMRAFLVKPSDEYEGAYTSDSEKVIGLMKDIGFTFRYKDYVINDEQRYTMLVFSVKKKSRS